MVTHMSVLRKLQNLIFNHNIIIPAIVCAIFGIASGFIFNYASVTTNIIAFIFNIFVFSLSIAVSIFFYLNGKLDEKRIIAFLVVCGFSLRLLYIVATGVEQRQHDVHSFGGYDGHAAYIEYLFFNKALPDVDPTLVWQFYHPPLHHIICALWLFVQTKLGIEYQNALEGLQYLTLFYSTISMIVGVKIFKLLSLKGKGLIVATAMLCFAPSFVIMSGSVNNDCLSVMFIILSVYFAMKWYQKPLYKTIIKLALCIGLGMITKLSVGLVSIGVAIVFLVKFIKAEKKLTVFSQLIAFGVICVPIGLSWSVRNAVLYGTPLNYVPMLDKDSFQYIGYHSAMQRLIDFRPFQLKSPFIAWGNSYFEYNPTVGLLKTSCFGEYVFEEEIISRILFWTFLVCVALAVCQLIRIAVSFKDNKCKMNTLLILIVSACYLVSYYVFCIQYPHTCTMNIRYAMICIILIAYLMGASLNDVSENSKFSRIKSIAIPAIVAVCSVSAIVFYSGIML